MPDGAPRIPYERLKELKYHAEMVVIAVGQGSFKGSDLWRIYVGMECNSLLANHWYEEAEKLKLENNQLLQELERLKERAEEIEKDSISAHIIYTGTEG